MALVAQYLFKDNANDETGNYNGTLGSTTAFEAVPSNKNFGGKVAVFDGTSSSRIILPPISPVSGRNARTIEFWQYTITNTGNRWQVSFQIGASSSADGSQFKLMINSQDNDDKPYIFTSSANCGWSSAPSRQTWHHHVLTFPQNGNASSFNYYLDGVLQTRNTSDTRDIDTYNGPECYISNSVNAKIANLRLYNEVLSAATIQNHYQIESSPPPQFPSRNVVDDDVKEKDA